MPIGGQLAGGLSPSPARLVPSGGDGHDHPTALLLPCAAGTSDSRAAGAGQEANGGGITRNSPIGSRLFRPRQPGAGPDGCPADPGQRGPSPAGPLAAGSHRGRTRAPGRPALRGGAGGHAGRLSGGGPLPGGLLLVPQPGEASCLVQQPGRKTLPPGKWRSPAPASISWGWL